MLAVISYRQWERFITAIYQAVAAQVGARGQAAQARVRGQARQWFDAKWIKRAHMNRKMRRIHPIQSDMPTSLPYLHGPCCRQSPTPF
ncbi:hypothetical protein ASA_2204 [Aeromonas salmonicida subsp. salmonicida A449]|uniref:Uncharacterized protein n=1 Tax=Aeromonas salmonicida (strain A449) TaxID=382245 RepID=A4SMZ4_AERS4|nr:hypothetical protein ASA_2204 [Aeromonas salmonicida subsp. salmonicida A449]